MITINREFYIPCDIKWYHEDELYKNTVENFEFPRTVLYKYNYINHTADVIICAESSSTKQSLASLGVALARVECNEKNLVNNIGFTKSVSSNTNGQDFIFKFLDSLLNLYFDHNFILKDLIILSAAINFKKKKYEVCYVALGDIFSSEKHGVECEVKAITRHQIICNFNLTKLSVLLDI